MVESEEYSAKHIQVLEGLEAVRKRPAMYIGDVGKRGFHHLLYEIVDNSIDEALAGFASNINITLHNDGSASVEDDGRGIPVDTHKTGKSALEIVATKLHAGGKFEKKAYQVSGGLHGVGISVVNALSEWMVITVYRDGFIWEQRYERGKPVTSVEKKGMGERAGTLVRFKPDPEIFGEQEFDAKLLADRFDELAYLNKGVKITFNDERSGKTVVFHHEGGVKEFVEHISKNKQPLCTPIHGEKTSGSTYVEFALTYTKAYSSTLLSFVNSIRTIEGGTHVAGFKSALTRTLNDYGTKMNLLKGKRLSGDDVLEGLVAVINTRVAEPQFEGQTKTKLGNSDVKSVVDRAVSEMLRRYLEEHPSDARLIIAKCLQTLEAREAAQKAREVVRRKNVLESSILPGKLADCIENDPTKAELFIVEGDSAGGSAKQGRDRRYQAILPLRGKILNVEKANMRRMLDSKEIKALIVSLGCGFGDQLDLSKLRYNKIIIMTDADVDGSHIRTLLLTFFYRYYRELVERGHIYIAQPPLYKIRKGKHVEYAFSDEEKDAIVERLGGKAEIQRYKGLGEMNPEQLWETTMNQETRLIKKVTIEDAEEADRLFRVLMGDKVEPRREFIYKYAKEVTNLDI